MLLQYITVFVFLSAPHGNQYHCLEKCGTSGKEIGVYESIDECCVKRAGGAYVQVGSDDCNICSPFVGTCIHS